MHKHVWCILLQRQMTKSRPTLVNNRVVDPDPEPDPDPYWIRIQSGLWIRIRIRIQEGKNDPQKKKKIGKSSCFEVLDGLF